MEVYQHIFRIDYEAVRAEINEPNQTFFFFPLIQSRPVTADTPVSPERGDDRHTSKALPGQHPKPLCTTHTEINHLRGIRVSRDHARWATIELEKLYPATLLYHTTLLSKSRSTFDLLFTYIPYFRLIIPVVLKPVPNSDTSVYVILPDFVVTSFDDIETWLIAFSKKFIVKEGDRQDTMHIKVASDLPGSAPRMTYDLAGLSVQAWTTVEEAKLYYQIFSPATFPVNNIFALLKGREGCFRFNQRLLSNTVTVLSLSDLSRLFPQMYSTLADCSARSLRPVLLMVIALWAYRSASKI